MEVNLISNKKCAQMLTHNVSDNKFDRKRVQDSFPNGLVDQILCSVGIEDPKTGIVSVCFNIFIALPAIDSSMYNVHFTFNLSGTL